MDFILTFIKQSDKQMHMLGCYALTLTLALFTLPLYAAAIAFAIGFAKELYDYRHPLTHTADSADLLADTIGITAALLPLLITV